MDVSKEQASQEPMSKPSEVIDVPFQVKSGDEPTSQVIADQSTTIETASRLAAIRRTLTRFVSPSVQQEVLPSVEIAPVFDRSQTLQGALGLMESNLLNDIAHKESILEGGKIAASKQTWLGKKLFNSEDEAKRMVGGKLTELKNQLTQLRNGNPQPAVEGVYKDVEKNIRGLTFAVRRNSDFIDAHIAIVRRDIEFLSKIDRGTAARANAAFARALDGKY